MYSGVRIVPMALVHLSQGEEILEDRFFARCLNEDC